MDTGLHPPPHSRRGPARPASRRHRSEAGRHGSDQLGPTGARDRWVSDLVHEDEFTSRRRVGTHALAAGGALIGGIVGAAFGLGSFSLVRFGSWHTAIVGAARLLWIQDAGAKALAAREDAA